MKPGKQFSEMVKQGVEDYAWRTGFQEAMDDKSDEIQQALTKLKDKYRREALRLIVELAKKE